MVSWQVKQVHYLDRRKYPGKVETSAPGKVSATLAATAATLLAPPVASLPLPPWLNCVVEGTAGYEADPVALKYRLRAKDALQRPSGACATHGCGPAMITRLRSNEKPHGWLR